MSFELVQSINGLLATVYADDLAQLVENMGLELNGVETRTCLRPCLQGQPKIRGFIGPCYGGEVNGVPVIRYEDAAAYRELSQ